MNSKGFLLVILLFTLNSCKENTDPQQKVQPAEQAIDTREYLKKGQQIAMQTQQVLGTTLKQKIAEGGPENAIAFCNLRALPITDSLAKVHHARIRRVTNKTRNGVNRANSEALSIMKRYKDQLEKGETLEGVVYVKNDHIQTYYPIMTAHLCMQCHGIPVTDIKAGTMSSILERYPADRAKGYTPGELRGLWSIQFEKQP
ncbi:Tll0287-like domain-containing protein [Robertkochia sediminum]|uniref:Tll0287-like domain-containing protein n=1 Tax=Robertkochia sediminum TaxID=2785326 RepID=UPI001932A3C4|nr:DUF3365 domain-containing protein [Robertkochia sediminum]MBL7472950.1 DUF3365 domain-containing protein [Robertkochia sediminum]